MSTQALSAAISSLSLLLVQTQAARWKAATPEQLTGAHLYLDIAKSGYLFHAVGNAMFVTPRAVPLIFRLNEKTDFYHDHPRHFADELPDYLGWIQPGPVSTYGDKEAYPWKILTEVIYCLKNVEQFWNLTQINKISPGTLTDTQLRWHPSYIKGILRT